MKRILASVVLVASTGALAAPPVQHHSTAGGPVLWHGIRAGMNEAQLRAAVPGLTKDAAGVGFNAPPTKVVGQAFSVWIEMIAGKAAGEHDLFEGQLAPVKLGA